MWAWLNCPCTTSRRRVRQLHYICHLVRLPPNMSSTPGQPGWPNLPEISPLGPTLKGSSSRRCLTILGEVCKEDPRTQWEQNHIFHGINVTPFRLVEDTFRADLLGSYVAASSLVKVECSAALGSSIWRSLEKSSLLSKFLLLVRIKSFQLNSLAIIVEFLCVVVLQPNDEHECIRPGNSLR